MHVLRNLCVVSAIFISTGIMSQAFADDWTQWRGNHRDGKSNETGLMSSWPEGGGSLCYADGKLIILGDNNEVAMIEATGEGSGNSVDSPFQIRLTAEMPRRGPTTPWRKDRSGDRR